MDLSFLPPELRINISEYAGTRGSRALASTNRRMRSIYSDTAFDKLILKRAINDRRIVVGEFVIVMMLLIKSMTTATPSDFSNLTETFINNIIGQRFSVTTGQEVDMSLPIIQYKQAIIDDIMAFSAGTNTASSHSDLYDAVLMHANVTMSGFMDMMSVFLGTMASVSPGDFNSLIRTFVRNAFAFIKDLITRIEVTNDDGSIRTEIVDNYRGIQELTVCEDIIQVLLEEFQSYFGTSMQFNSRFGRIIDQAENALVNMDMFPQYVLTEEDVAPMSRPSFNMKRRGRKH